MNFKTFFLLIIIALSSNSYAQWWQSGGNLIWPYGNVEIVSGDLSVQSYPLMPYSKVIWLEFRTDVVSEYDYYQYVSILKTIGFDNYDTFLKYVGYYCHLWPGGLVGKRFLWDKFELPKSCG